MSAGPLHDLEERVLGCVFTFSDISKLKRAEEALRASEQRLREQAQRLEQQLIASGRLVSLGELTASMAHEFNNPLGIIMGFVEDMLSGIDPADPQLQSLQIIDEEAKRCHHGGGHQISLHVRPHSANSQDKRASRHGMRRSTVFRIG